MKREGNGRYMNVEREEERRGGLVWSGVGREDGRVGRGG